MTTVDRVYDASTDDDLVDTREAARLLGVRHGSMASTGIAPAARVDGRRLWRRSDLDAYRARPAVRIRRERDARPKPATELVPGRFSLDPLLYLMREDAGRDQPLTVIADRLAIHRSAIYRLLREGLTSTMADRLAIRAGWHPGIVWGLDWWDESRHAPRVRVRRLRRQQGALRAAQRRHPSYRPNDLPPAA